MPLKDQNLIRIPKIIAVLIIATGPAGLLAQQIPRDVLQNVAQLSASGSVEVQQDLLTISMATTVGGADAASVQNQLKQALDAALLQARPLALPGQMDVRTGNFSLYPRYGKDGRVNSWQGSTELMLEGRDFARITGTAGKIQTLTLSNVSFALSREQRARVEGEAQAMAIERYKARALEVSKSFGFSAYTLREVTVSANDQGFTPRPRMAAMQAKTEMSDSPVSVEAGKSTVLVNVTGSVQMR